MPIEMLKKYREVLAYLVFGVLTVLINTVAYGICYYTIHLSNNVSVVAAWLIAVCFAFVTNKFFVFESKGIEKSALAREAGLFWSCRIATGILELIMMHIFVDRLGLNGLVMKTVTNVIVIVLNYIASKMLVFKKK